MNEDKLLLLQIILNPSENSFLSKVIFFLSVKETEKCKKTYVHSRVTKKTFAKQKKSF